MRKNSPRKWLHACLDLLPVILIPVFMIYSHRHTIDNGSIQVQEKIAVDFNQLSQSVNYVNSEVDSRIVFNYQIQVLQDSTYLGNVFGININDVGLYNARFVSGFNGNKLRQKHNGSTLDLTFNLSSFEIVQGHTYICSNYFDEVTPNVVGEFQVSNMMIFDLTQMFGLGNEPTTQEFFDLFPQSYYQYTLSHKELIDGDLVTYNDTDIMSQFTYQLYNSVDKYFNMGNVFNMNGVYDWFNLNIFNGSAPIYIYVVWQIVLYEFVMDLLFLLYGLFMWFIDMVQHLMDKPFKSIK